MKMLRYNVFKPGNSRTLWAVIFTFCIAFVVRGLDYLCNIFQYKCNLHYINEIVNMRGWLMYVLIALIIHIIIVRFARPEKSEEPAWAPTRYYAYAALPILCGIVGASWNILEGLEGLNCLIGSRAGSLSIGEVKAAYTQVISGTSIACEYVAFGSIGSLISLLLARSRVNNGTKMGTV